MGNKTIEQHFIIKFQVRNSSFPLWLYYNPAVIAVRLQVIEERFHPLQFISQKIFWVIIFLQIGLPIDFLPDRFGEWILVSRITMSYPALKLKSFRQPFPPIVPPVFPA
jgi:hypothetical protein